MTSQRSRTAQTSPNDILELDAHVDHSQVPGPPSETHELVPDQLGVLADALARLDADRLSARMEIERRHLLENPEHVLRFTAETLTEMVTVLAIARTVSRDEADLKTTGAIETFGHLIRFSTEAPMDAASTPIEIPGFEPADDEPIDPFRVIISDQRLEPPTGDDV